MAKNGNDKEALPGPRERSGGSCQKIGNPRGPQASPSGTAPPGGVGHPGTHTGTPIVEELTNGNASRAFDPHHPLHQLTPEQIDEIGEAFQKIHDDVRDDLGAPDADYIRSLVQFTAGSRRSRGSSSWRLATRRRGPRDDRALRGENPREHGAWATTSCTDSGTG